jgi:hypothetical protein
VGEYQDANNDAAAVVVPITGGVSGAGVETAPADVNSNPAADLVDVACPAAGSCEGVGEYDTTAGVQQNMVVPITGGVPGTATGVALPADTSAYAYMTFSGLSCSSSVLCVAAGSYYGSGNYEQPAVMQITGAGATAVESASPANANTSPAYAAFSVDYGSPVACVPSGPCLATGYYSTAANEEAFSGLVAEISANGGVGSTVTTPAPADVETSGPNGVGPEDYPYYGTACTASGSCLATGGYFQNLGHYLPYMLSEQAPLTISSSSPTGATQGSAYQATLMAAGAWGSYNWSISSGSLPAGLSLNQQTGVISGTPTGSGSSSFTVQVTGTGSPVQTATEALSLTVAQVAATTTTTNHAPPPTPTVKLLSSSTAVSGNRLGVKLACSGAACGGTVKLEVNKTVTVKRGKKRVRKHEMVVLGSVRYAVAIGGTKTLEVALNGAGKRALANAKNERLAVTVVATVAGGEQVSRRETISAVVKRKKR